MNIQKFRAPTMRQAMAQIRAQLGPDAVIVHSTVNGTEANVVAATEYDEQLAGLLNAANPGTNEAADDAAGGNVAASSGKTSSPAATAPVNANPTLAAAARVLGRRAVFGAESSPKTNADLYGPDGHAANPASAPAEVAAPVGRSEPTAPIAEVGRSSDRLDDVGAELRSLRDLLEAQVSELAWRDTQQRHPQRTRVLKRLLALGLTPALCSNLVDRLRFEATEAESYEAAKADLAERVQVADGISLLMQGGLVALVGPTGAGKTTTAAKLAGAHILRHGPGSVGLITTDDFRLGAHEQLQAFGRILDIAVVKARDSDALIGAVESFRNRSLVLIDTEGGPGRALAQRRMLADLAEENGSVRTYVVLAANAERRSLIKTLNTYGLENLNGAVVSKLDECGTLGEVLSALVATRLPVTFVTDGQQVPQDLHQADALVLVQRAHELGIANADGDMLNDEVLGLTMSALNATPAPMNMRTMMAGGHA